MIHCSALLNWHPSGNRGEANPVPFSPPWRSPWERHDRKTSCLPPDSNRKPELSQLHPALGWSYTGNQSAAVATVTFLGALGIWTLDTAESLPTFKKEVMVQPYTFSLSKFTLKYDFTVMIRPTPLPSLSSCFVSPVQTKIMVPFFHGCTQP